MKTIKKDKKAAIVRSRMNEKRKKHAENIFKKLGINHSEAINLFYAQVELRKGLPFDLCIPNAKTQKVLKESKEGKNIKHFNTKKELFEDLGL